MADLTPDIVRRLAKAGDTFGFEMRVGKVLRSASVRQSVVEHGGTYRPTGINQPHRQFDYRFTLGNQHRVLILAVECKNLFAGSPLVLSGALREDSESYFDLLASDQRLVSNGAFAEPKVVAVRVPLQPSRCYPVGGFAGKATMRPEPSSPSKELVPGTAYRLTGDGDVFEKWNQAVNHTVYMMERCPRLFASTRITQFVAYLPFVVVPDGTLWIIRYDPDGEIVDGPRVVDSADLYIGSSHYIGGNADQTARISHIHFSTLSGLQTFVAEAADSASDLWDRMFPPQSISAYNGRRNEQIRAG